MYCDSSFEYFKALGHNPDILFVLLTNKENVQSYIILLQIMLCALIHYGC